MIPVLVAVGTSAVLVRVLGITLSPLSTVGGPLVVATCAEFSVLLIARYAEERDARIRPSKPATRWPRTNRSGVLHVGAHDARRICRADLLVAAAAVRLRHGRDDQHRRRSAVRARRRATARQGVRPARPAGDGSVEHATRLTAGGPRPDGSAGPHWLQSDWQSLQCRVRNEEPAAAAPKTATEVGRTGHTSSADDDSPVDHIAAAGQHVAARSGRASGRPRRRRRSGMR